MNHELREVGEGVMFSNEEIGHYDDSGDFVFGVPGLIGEYHVVDGVVIAGPAPGSKAEELLGDGRYTWNKREKCYKIIPADSVAQTKSRVSRCSECGHVVESPSS